MSCLIKFGSKRNTSKLNAMPGWSWPEASKFSTQDYETIWNASPPLKIKIDQQGQGTTPILLLAPAQSVTMKRVMIQIIWEPVTQRTGTHKTERPELLDDPLQLVGRRCGLLDSDIVPPPEATHKSRSSSGCLGQLASWQAVEEPWITFEVVSGCHLLFSRVTTIWNLQQ